MTRKKEQGYGHASSDRELPTKNIREYTGT